MAANIALSSCLRTQDIFTAGKILAELDYAEKPPKPYTKQEKFGSQLVVTCCKQQKIKCWRRGRDSNPRANIDSTTCRATDGMKVQGKHW